MNKELSNLFNQVLEQEAEKDSFSFGKTGERWKIYTNLKDPEEVKRKIEIAIGAREYARSLSDEEAEGRRLDLMSKFLEEAQPEEDKQEGGSDEEDE